MTDRMKALVKKYGSEEAAQAKLKEWGRKGGKAQVKKGFANMDREKLSEVSSKGGKAFQEKYRQLNK